MQSSGYLLAIGSWVLLNTINPLLLKNDAQITIQTPASPVTALPSGSDPMPTVPGWYYRYKNLDGVTQKILHDSTHQMVALR